MSQDKDFQKLAELIRDVYTQYAGDAGTDLMYRLALKVDLPLDAYFKCYWFVVGYRCCKLGDAVEPANVVNDIEREALLIYYDRYLTYYTEEPWVRD